MNSSPRPKSVAALFLLGAFLTGAAVFYASTRLFTAPPAITPPATLAQMRDRWKSDLNLSPDQAVQFDASYDERKAALDSIRNLYRKPVDSIAAQYQPAIDSVRISNQQKVMQFLDSSQKIKYQQMIDADKRKADSLRKAGVVK